MKNTDAIGHVTGQSVYLDDIELMQGCLFGAVYSSPVAHADLLGLDYEKALALPGVIAVITAKDIPGENQVGGIIQDEPLFAEDQVHFMGQPIALVVAENEAAAREALELISIETRLLEVVTDPREAQKKGMLLVPPRIFSSGNIEDAWGMCDHIFEGVAETGGQEHLYIETQGAYSYIMENRFVKIHSSTQGPTAVQKTAAKVLGIPMHQVEVDVVRLGGGFGGKEDQATPFACMAALAAWVLRKPVKISLHRMDDMRITGKRHPYSADFRIGLTKDLRIQAYQAIYYQNGGAATDLSPAILERSLFHAGNAYYIPNAHITAYSCKTNLPPNTAFRGFGGPQAMFVIESAIARAAFSLGVDARAIQQKNLLKEGNRFHYGQIARNANIRKAFKAAGSEFGINKLFSEKEKFNKQNALIKKGLALMPICFGISFTNKSMNQARALVHIYQDGSVAVNTGAIEMGQGVNTKIAQVASITLGIDPSRIKLHSTNTSRVANTSPTAASSGADLNGHATRIACQALIKRLLGLASRIYRKPVKNLSIVGEQLHAEGVPIGLKWEELIQKAYLERIQLTENGHYATPLIYFDAKTSKGHPFAYHVYGLAVLTARLDCIRGTYVFERVGIVHDFGTSINSLIDLGQVEGALVQGLGWMTMEEIAFSPEGRLLSGSLSTYKVPDIYSAPENLDVLPLNTQGPEHAILRSKAVGEPPFMYGIGGFFAIQDAIRAFNPNYVPDFDAPMTPEKVLMRLYQ